MTKPFNFEDLKNRLNNARKLKYSKAAAAEGEDDPAMMRSVLYHDSQDYASELDFSKVERFIGKSEFENYVRQMSQSKAANTCAFALRVANGAEISAQTSSMDFYKTFLNIAQAMAQETKSAGSLLTYAGNGFFLAAEHGNRLTDTQRLEKSLTEALASAHFNGPRPDIAVGTHAEMETFEATSGTKLLEDAMARAENSTPTAAAPASASASEPAEPHPQEEPERVYAQRPQRPEQPSNRARPDRKAYEQILIDSLRNG